MVKTIGDGLMCTFPDADGAAVAAGEMQRRIAQRPPLGGGRKLTIAFGHSTADIGFVSLIGFVLMAPVSSVTASYGARMAHALSRRALELTFGLFLLVASLRFLASLVW